MMKLKSFPFKTLLIIISIACFFNTPINANIIYRERPASFESPPLTYDGSTFDYGYSFNRISFNVLTNNTKVREKPYEDSDVIRTLDAGTEVIVIGAAKNKYGNTWFLLDNDEGYIYSKKVSFNIKNNSTTEYLCFKHMEEIYPDETSVFLAQAGMLIALFTQEGDKYFESLLGQFGKDTEYIILSETSCYTIPSSSMKYVYYGYLAARLGFSERELLLITSNAESLARLFTDASNDTNGNLFDGIEILTEEMISPFPVLAPWFNAAFDVMPLYNFKEIESSLKFINHCKKELCNTESQRGLISIGYNLGLEDQ